MALKVYNIKVEVRSSHEHPSKCKLAVLREIPLCCEISTPDLGFLCHFLRFLVLLVTKTHYKQLKRIVCFLMSLCK